MNQKKLLRLLLLPIVSSVVLLFTAGCSNSASDDLERAKSGAPLKTPSEIQKEAKAKNAAASKPR
jgi:hypothetical protein